MAQNRTFKRQWREYRTPQGNRPVREFLDDLPSDHRNEILAAMKDVAHNGLVAARHLQGKRYADLWEVRAYCGEVIYRVLFSPLGRFNQVLLSLHAFNKKSQKTAVADLDVALARLADWTRRTPPP